MKKMTRYSDIAKTTLLIIHIMNVWTIFIVTIDIDSDLRKLFMVLYLILTNIAIYRILKRFGKVWFK